MIDINKLRRLAQEATPGPWYIGSGTYEGRNIYSVEAVTDDEGFTYNPVVATAEDDDVVCWDANARLIAAVNPATINELLDRLEAAEKDITIKEEVIDSLAVVVKRLDAQCDAAEAEAIEQSRLNGMGSEREAALMAKLEAAEKERDECNRRRLEAADHFAAQTALMKEQLETLRAKIAEMERQEPAYWGPKHAIEGGSTTVIVSKFPVNPTDAPLYALPGAQIAPNAVAYLDLGVGGYMDIGTDLTDEELATLPKGRHMLGIIGTYGVDGYVPVQPAPSIHEGVRKVTLGFRWESEAQHHIPTIEIEFDPVSPGSPNDAKGWQDRDRIASMLSPEAKP